jgi:Txe/YoeB family toxin of Txe-Axe toxin-antitoxin module
MSNCEAAYEKLFIHNLNRYSSIRRYIRRHVERVLKDPYHNTEFLEDITGKLNLTGCRSTRIDRNFRIIFVICEECRNMEDCEYCFCENLSDETVVFLTVGPHDKAYAIK